MGTSSAGTDTARTAAAGRDLRADPSRERGVILNQLLLGLVVLFACVLVLVSGSYTHLPALVIGANGIFVATAIAVLVRWDRLPPLATITIPALDIASIGVLQLAHPLAGLSLLWAFPVLWIALTYGARLTTAAVTSVTLMYWALLSSVAQTFEVRAALLPLTMVSLGVLGQALARRFSAQRLLLAQQSQTLQGAFERARTQEALVSEVLQAVDFGVVRVGRGGAGGVENEAHGALLGAPGIPLFQADGRTPVPPEEHPLERARRGETFESLELWLGEVGSGRKALAVTARRVREDGRAAIVVVTRDVTNEVMALRARDDLVASVSHELRTPLTSILGFLDLALDDDRLSDATRRSLDVADRNAQRLIHLVNDILSASSVPADPDLGLRPGPMSVSSVVRQAVEAAEPRAAEQGIVLDTTAVEHTEAVGDAARLRQVIDNLLSNAVKYSHSGGRVWVGCTQEDGSAVIAVRDEGPGIAEAEQERLFERFFRSDAVRNSSIHGSGLGLAISRDIVRAHGGDIAVRSRPGEGATFVVRIPRRGVTAASGAQHRQAAEEAP